MMIKDVPAEERPRERLMRLGAEALSNAELIALLLRTGSTNESVLALAQRVLVKTGGLKGLTRASLMELTKIRGIGTAKAIQLLAGVELGLRISRQLPEESMVIRTPYDAAQCVMEEMRYLEQEHFLCLFLNTKNKIIHKKCIFIGSLNVSVVHPREVFREAIRHSSAGIICVHNHPSGDPTPSREDLEVTQRLVEAGKLMGIELIDHLIIGDQTYFSMKEKGLIIDSFNR
ncbi:RadC family protein [Thermoflavimicrobium dichotomicum]|uniref:DNA repair protein RadC n=1 Tax=Thermoflavimicrobium dichotomicum TaxID=46223 RepID=A0A1I3R5J1_9BACL|nr:DNA repair protein RadC [Thermoflavimicrobium dichotomicum]SFJ41883.1 DNA repair protein RadC [Thermoflavimicrobium dichotomicum]